MYNGHTSVGETLIYGVTEINRVAILRDKVVSNKILSENIIIKLRIFFRGIL